MVQKKYIQDTVRSSLIESTRICYNFLEEMMPNLYLEQILVSKLKRHWKTFHTKEWLENEQKP
jgi:hypothetical protein